MFGKYSTSVHKEFLFLIKKICKRYQNLIKHLSIKNLGKVMIDFMKITAKKYLSVLSAFLLKVNITIYQKECKCKHI